MGNIDDFENRIYEVSEKGGERLDVVKVFKAVDGVKQRFDVSDIAEERALKSQIWLVDKKTFEEYTEYYLKSIGMDLTDNLKSFSGPQELADALGINVGDLNIRRKNELERLRAHISSNQGISLPLESGGALILINKESCDDVEMAVTHELVHAMMDENPGHYEDISNTKRGGFDSRGLNEATVQLITLCSLHLDMDIKAVLRDIREEKMLTPYLKELKILDMLMWATTLGDNGDTVDFDKVAALYFDEESEPRLKTILLKMKMAKNIPEEALETDKFRDKCMKLFDSI